MDIKIKLVRSAEKFGLLQDSNAAKPFKIVLKDVKLHMRKVLPTLMLRECFKNKLLKEPCYLPFSDTHLKHYVIPQGVSSFNIANIANGTLPKQVFFVLVHNQAMSHAPDKNPFNFQYLNLSSFNLKKNGQCIFPKPFQPNIQEGDAVDLYQHLYNSIGISHGNQSIGLSYDAFINGRFFLAADLTPDQCYSYHIHPENYGNLDLELAFSVITPHPIYVLALSIFNSGIKIDQFQQVIKGSNYDMESGLSNIFLINYIQPRCKNFIGFFSSDDLPSDPLALPCCLIANLSKRNQKRSNFVAMYIDEKNQLYYFDSFGIYRRYGINV